MSKRDSISQTAPAKTNGISAPRTSGFTPVNPVVVPDVQRISSTKAATPATPSQPDHSLKDFASAPVAMRFRGKTWHFDSLVHKSRVLELIILQEEKEVESYPMKAFSGKAKRGAYGEDDVETGDNLLKDYFRFYTHFMTERFPATEKILLEHGVKPSA
jgi:hypothetical protein